MLIETQKFCNPKNRKWKKGKRLATQQHIYKSDARQKTDPFSFKKIKKFVRFRKSSKTTLYTVQQFHSAGNRHNIKRN